MNKLEAQLKNKLLHVVDDTDLNIKKAAKECANITEEMCIKFDKWKRYFLKTTKDDYDLYLLPKNPMGRWYTVEELFQEFIKTL